MSDRFGWFVLGANAAMLLVSISRGQTGWALGHGLFCVVMPILLLRKP